MTTRHPTLCTTDLAPSLSALLVPWSAYVVPAGTLGIDRAPPGRDALLLRAAALCSGSCSCSSFCFALPCAFGCWNFFHRTGRVFSLPTPLPLERRRIAGKHCHTSNHTLFCFFFLYRYPTPPRARVFCPGTPSLFPSAALAQRVPLGRAGVIARAVSVLAGPPQDRATHAELELLQVGLD
jgi:hypothetical protein